MSKVLALIKSDSDPTKYHKITEGNDGVIYCTCWAWKRNRNCKHLITYFREKEAYNSTRVEIEDIIQQEISFLKTQ